MSEVDPQDYTPGELTRAAEVCKDAVELLQPASTELMSIAEEIDPDRHDDALHYARTARHLGGAAFHLKGGEAELRWIAEKVGGSYASVRTWLIRLSSIGWLVVIALSLLKLVLPQHAGQIVIEFVPGGIGLATGFSGALSIFDHYVTGKRRTDGRKR